MGHNWSDVIMERDLGIGWMRPGCLVLSGGAHPPTPSRHPIHPHQLSRRAGACRSSEHDSQWLLLSPVSGSWGRPACLRPAARARRR